MPHRVLAHAKVNLSLRVLAREAGGYHQVESLFCALELADEIEVALDGGDGIRLDVASPTDVITPPPDLGPVEQNLAWRAAAAFAGRAGTSPGIAIRLAKRIPHGAGLGGGSSDAAAVLRALNTLHGDRLPREALLDIAAGLGSDVPFFLTGAALALAWGRGGRLAPLPALPARPVVLAVPRQRVGTADAYEALARTRGREQPHAAAVIDLPIRDWADAARGSVNDFEDIVFRDIPALHEVRELLDRSGALLARMTGTGSVVFGVFENADAAAAAADRLRALGGDIDVITTATLGSVAGPEPDASRPA